MVASGHEALHESYFSPRRNLPPLIQAIALLRGEPFDQPTPLLVRTEQIEHEIENRHGKRDMFTHPQWIIFAPIYQFNECDQFIDCRRPWLGMPVNCLDADRSMLSNNSAIVPPPPLSIEAVL
jgi:hypothetical protein